MTKTNALLTLLAMGLALPAFAQNAPSNVTIGGVDSQTGATLTPMAADPVTTGYVQPAQDEASATVPPTVADMVNRAAADASASQFVPFQSFEGDMQGAAGMPTPASATVPAMPSSAMAMPTPAASASPDVDFLRGMIAHHQNAIDMAKLVLKTGNDPYVKMLANDIIGGQGREIDWMKAWLEVHGPNAAMAKDVGTPPNHSVSATLPPLPEKAKPAAKPAPKKKPATKKPAVKKEVTAEPAAEGTLESQPEATAPAKRVAKTPAKAAAPAATEGSDSEAPQSDMGSFGGSGGMDEGGEDAPSSMPNAFGR